MKTVALILDLAMMLVLNAVCIIVSLDPTRRDGVGWHEPLVLAVAANAILLLFVPLCAPGAFVAFVRSDWAALVLISPLLPLLAGAPLAVMLLRRQGGK